MERKRGPLVGLISWLLVVSSLGPAAAAVPTHASAMTSATAFWLIKGPAGLRYGSVLYLENNQDGEIEVLAFMSTGTCRKPRPGYMTCKSDHHVSHTDYDPVFLMDPAMQLATLELGPHRVRWDSQPGTPQLSFIGMTCDPEDEDEFMGPKLSRRAVAEADIFGEHFRTRGYDHDYGSLSRGALLTDCAWGSGTAPFRIPLRV
ncbi:MAG TPA: hypothetical protein VE174_08655 [Actinomycetota bacterium]|nr:hypothetical protein [Actinomycetota bacterium]